MHCFRNCTKSNVLFLCNINMNFGKIKLTHKLIVLKKKCLKAVMYVLKKQRCLLRFLVGYYSIYEIAYNKNKLKSIKYLLLWHILTLAQKYEYTWGLFVHYKLNHFVVSLCKFISNLASRIEFFLQTMNFM